MPKSKKTKLVKSPVTEREQKSKKEEKVERKAVSKYNNSQEQIKEVVSLTTENNETNDFLIIAGSYERILYGIGAHWIKGESSDNVRIFKVFYYFFFLNQIN